MAPTATAPATDPKAELSTLTTELSGLNGKLATEQAQLDTLTREKDAIAEKIATGKAKPEAAGEIERKLEGSRAAVSGLQAIIGRKNKRVSEVRPIVQRADAAEKLAAHRAELAKLKADGEAIAARINEKLTAIIGEDFPALDAIRDKMAKEYTDGLNGPTEAGRLIRLLKREDDVLVAETAIRKAKGWPRRSDLQLTLHNLRPKANRWP